ncbi:ATP-binding protein [Fulvivirgaceae bacterium BMA10]|uniref:histidine kinase n=2 Tax=Splendidivirga corallicola TaxID=3051826 RepID=A0ABT8KJ64_9BACT|nr:ATP-binding protein [Fulvivirgaceae bacterium BMA10]
MTMAVWWIVKQLTSNYEINKKVSAALNEIHQLDILTNQALLKLKGASLFHYDALVTYEKRIREIILSFDDRSFDAYYSEDNTLKDRVHELQELYESKWNKIEQFKARNSIFKNSVNHIPFLIARIHQKTGISQLNELLPLLLHYIASPDVVDRRDIDRIITDLKLNQESLDTVTADQIAVILQHADIILGVKVEIEQDIQQILNVPTVSKGEELFAITENAFETKVRKNEYLSYLVYVFCGLLMIVIAYMLHTIIENQKELVSLNATLEQKVYDRTATVTQQNQKLKELNIEKNNLIDIVAHDLRSPLNHIIGLVGLMKAERSGLAQDQEEYVNTIHHSAQKLVKMVSKILDTKVLENEEINIEFKNIALVDVLKQTLSQFKIDAEKKNIEFKVEIDGDHLMASLDENYLTQIYENLISNALKFSDRGKSVVVRLFKTPEGLIRTEIQDEGPGISEVEMSKLFEKFQRLSARPTGGESSVGLGLSIVKKYVEAMDGNIWCESEPGKGAKFVVEFSSVTYPGE